MQRVLITGADGFVGRAARSAFRAAGYRVRGSVRADRRDAAGDRIVTGDLTRFHDWKSMFADVEAVVHLANLAHVPRAEVSRARATNVEASTRLAEAAAAHGVRRLVYLSSLKVHGEETTDAPFTETSPIAPRDPYGAIKAEAEVALRSVAARTGLELAVLRPPLVYGAGVKANFLALMKAVARGWPLPLDSIANRRSLVSVDNLAQAIVCCVAEPRAAARTYLVSDGPPLATPELCRMLGRALGRRARLFPFPVALLERVPALRKLACSLEIDDAAIRRELKWSPVQTTQEGLEACARWFRGAPSP